MAKKLRLGILFGGRSGEHAVSLRSAASILKAIDRRRYEIVPIGITREGHWLHADDATALLNGTYGLPAALPAEAPVSAEVPQLPASPEAPAVAVVPSEALSKKELKAQAKLAKIAAAAIEHAAKKAAKKLKKDAGLTLAASAELVQPSSGALGVDVVFPVLHGTFGEDGTMQGLFELAGVAYVGSGVLGSAVGMDKDAMKRAFAAAGLPITPHVTLLRSEWRADPKKCAKQIEKSLRYPVFVKPANLGSSVGISKVHGRKELSKAMDLAADFDRKIVIEQGVGGPGVKPRELEIAVLGNDEPEASVVGEIVPAKEFYDYEAKYELAGPDESVSIIPAELSKPEAKALRAMAIAAFRACDCAGLARVDFLMSAAVAATDTEPARPAELYLNEINTMPGFTSISMYPKLWEASGIGYAKLIDRLIALALERAKERRETRFSM